MEHQPPVLPVIETNRSRVSAWLAGVLWPATPQGVARLLVLSMLYSSFYAIQRGVRALKVSSGASVDLEWWFLGPGRLIIGAVGLPLVCVGLVGVVFPRWHRWARLATVSLLCLALVDVVVETLSFSPPFSGWQLHRLLSMSSHLAFIGLAVALQYSPDTMPLAPPSEPGADQDGAYLPYVSPRAVWPTGLITAMMLGTLLASCGSELQLTQMPQSSRFTDAGVLALFGVPPIWEGLVGLACCVFSFILLRGRLLRLVFGVGVVIGYSPPIFGIASAAHATARAASQDLFRALGFFGTATVAVQLLCIAAGGWGMFLAARMHDGRRSG